MCAPSSTGDTVHSFAKLHNLVVMNIHSRTRNGLTSAVVPSKAACILIDPGFKPHVLSTVHAHYLLTFELSDDGTVSYSAN